MSVQAVLKCAERLGLCPGSDPLPGSGRRQEEAVKLKMRLGGALILDAKLAEQVWVHPRHLTSEAFTVK